MSLATSVRIFAFVTAAVLSLTACGGSSSTSAGSQAGPNETSAAGSGAETTAAATGGSETSDDDSTDTTILNVYDVIEEGLTNDNADTDIFVEYTNGKVSARVDGSEIDGAVKVATGSTVGVQVSSDVAEHVHVHGHDIFTEVGPERTVWIVFTADIPGTLEVELEDSFTLLFNLQVS